MSDELENLENAKQLAQSGLDEDEEAMLSKVLFPETHTEAVVVLGRKRKVHPLPVKPARKISATLRPVSEALQANESKDFTDELIDGLLESARVLADFYKWEDVLQAIDDEAVTTTDLQALLIAQNAIQGNNDFLLTPLRLAIVTMQLVEIGAIQAVKQLNRGSIGQQSKKQLVETSST